MNRVLRTMAMLVCGATALAAVAGTPIQSTDSRLWYCISDGTQRYGAIVADTRRLEDGSFAQEARTTMKMELFGAAQELGSTSKCVFNADLAPVSLSAQMTTMSGAESLEGRLDGKTFVVTIGKDEGTRTLKHPLEEDGVPLVLDAALPELLKRQPPDAREVRVRLLVSDNGDVMPITLRSVARDASSSTWSFAPTEGMPATTLRIDADGLMVDQSTRLPPVRIERCTEEASREIVTRKIPDRELLVFKLERPLPPSRRLQQVRFKVTWEGIPLDEFQLEDSRQHIQSSTEEGGRHTVIVALDRPGELASDVTRPLPADQFASTLGDGDFIKPTNERIAAKAREIVGDESSALAAVRAISKFVNGHVKTTMIAETLSGPEVLERATGKCTEFSTLFASLARAAGIPTRIALGQRRFDGSWGGHMWNEVFVGEWIPVDASVNEVGGSVDLLKFTHSDTVMGTQPLRWKLTESLGLALEDFTAIPTPEGDGEKTGLADGVYTNTDFGFRIRLPDEKWQFRSNDQGGSLTLRIRPPDESLGNALNIHMVAFGIPSGVAPKTILHSRINQHRAGLPDLTMTADEAYDVSGIGGHRTQLHGTPPGDGGVPVYVTETLWITDDTGYLVNLIGTKELHERFLKDYDAIISSFERIGR